MLPTLYQSDIINILQSLINSRFISYEDLKKLTNALNNLNMAQYKLEIDKIEPSSKEYLNIAMKGKNIIQSSINKLL